MNRRTSESVSSRSGRKIERPCLDATPTYAFSMVVHTTAAAGCSIAEYPNEFTGSVRSRPAMHLQWNLTLASRKGRWVRVNAVAVESGDSRTRLRSREGALGKKWEKNAPQMPNWR